MTDQQKIEAAKRELAGCISSSELSKALMVAIMETYHGMLVAVYEMLDK